MLTAEGIALHLQRLAEQQLSGSQLALGLQQQAEVADGAECIQMSTAQRRVT